MEPIVQSIILDDSKWSPVISEAIGGINDLADAGDATNEAFEKMSTDFKKSMEQYRKEAVHTSQKINELQSGNQKLVDSQSNVEKALTKTLAPLRFFGVDVDKLVGKISAFRARVLDQAQAQSVLDSALAKSKSSLTDLSREVNAAQDSLSKISAALDDAKKKEKEISIAYIEAAKALKERNLSEQERNQLGLEATANYTLYRKAQEEVAVIEEARAAKAAELEDATKRYNEEQKALTEETKKYKKEQDSANKSVVDGVKRFLSFIPIPARLKNVIIAATESLLNFKSGLSSQSSELNTTQASVEKLQGSKNKLINVLSNSFPKATKAVVGGLRAMKVALITTGIGAIVVLVGLLISGLIALGNSLKGTTSELSKTERIGILFKATFDSLLGIVSQVKDNLFALINGVKSLKEAFGDSAKAISQWGTTAVLAAAELEKAAIATKNSEAAQRTLSAAIALSKDELNKQREAAADNTKGIGARVSAIQKAAALEGSLEAQRIKALEETVKAEQARFRAAEITGKGQKEAAENAIAAQQELKLVQAEANARQRQDQAAINALYREGGERLQQFRDQYAELLKDLNQRVSSAKIDQLIGIDKINAELAVALKAIDDFEKEAKIAAGKARQAFDGSGFVTLRMLAEKKAEQERLKFTSKANLDRIEAERSAAGLRAQLIGESSDVLFNTEEARNQAVLEAERKGLEDRLKELQRFYQERGGIQSDAEKAELEQISIGIDLAKQKEAEGRKKAQDRIISDQLEGVQLESEIQELQLSLIRQSGDKTLTLEQYIENERLKIAEEAATKRLALLTELYGPDSPEVKLATAQLQVLRDTISRGPNPFEEPVRKFLKDALKVDDRELDFITSQLSGAFSNITAAAETFTRLQIEQGQKRIDALSKEIDETESLLEREQALKEQGYANDFTLYSENLARLNAERDRVAAENLEKQKKLANAQLAINTALQVSEYILTALNFFRKGSEYGPILGVALAIGAIGILASTVAQAKANAEQFKEVPTFHEGGPVAGALHGFGGKQIEVEGREFVVRGDVAQRHGDFLKMLNDGRFQQMDLMRALSSRNDIGPTLRKMEKDREVIVSLSGGIDYGRMESMYQRALEDMSGKVIGYLQTRPVEKLDAEGNIVKEWKEGNNVRRQRVIIKKPKAHA